MRTNEVDQSETVCLLATSPVFCLFVFQFIRCDVVNQLCALDDDSKKLGFYGVQSGMEVTKSLPPLKACMRPFRWCGHADSCGLCCTRMTSCSAIFRNTEIARTLRGIPRASVSFKSGVQSV